jgi:hypothetical protein
MALPVQLVAGSGERRLRQGSDATIQSPTRASLLIREQVQKVVVEEATRGPGSSRMVEEVRTVLQVSPPLRARVAPRATAFRRSGCATRESLRL